MHPLQTLNIQISGKSTRLRLSIRQSDYASSASPALKERIFEKNRHPPATADSKMPVLWRGQTPGLDVGLEVTGIDQLFQQLSVAD